MNKTIRVHITGKVQGVYFRQSTRDRAVELCVSGTVRNLPDGTVEIIATGSPEQLKELTNWCHSGPRNARVEKVSVREMPLHIFDSFDIIR